MVAVRSRLKCLNGTTLKAMAMLLMLLDHACWTIAFEHQWMTCAGRLAFPLFAFLNHLEKFGTFLCRRTRNTFICEDACVDPIGMFFDFFRIVRNLCFIAVRLLVRFRGYSAICRHSRQSLDGLND